MSPGRSRRRAAAFDPTRLDDLDDVLAAPGAQSGDDDPPSGTPDSDVGSRTAGASSTDPVAAAEGAEAVSAGSSTSSTTGSGAGEARSPRRNEVPASRRPSLSQRPAPAIGRQAKSARGRIATAVRVPSDVYHQVNDRLLAGPERPSYGQVVMWTLEDHHELVVGEVETNLPDPHARVPRGRRLAQDRVPVGLHLLGSERDQLDDVASTVADQYDVKVTRTDVAVAALRVALAVRLGSRDPR